MDRSRALVSLVAVVSLSLGAIWPNLASAAGAPAVQSLGALQEGLRVPGKLDLDAQGNLYVADARGKRILKYDASGVLRKVFDQVPVTGKGLAVVADGKRIYAEIKEKIAILDGETGARLGYLGGATPLTRAGGVDVDAAGRVYAIDELNRKIQVFDADGNALFAFSGNGTGDGLFRRITAMAVNVSANEVYVAGEGVLYATTDGKSVVQIFGLDGAFHGKLVLDSDFGGALSLCDGIAFDAAGREYYLDELKANVRVRDRSTIYLSTLEIGGAGDGKVRQPAQLAFDPVTSRLFVSSDNAKVEVFGIDGGSNPPRNHAPGVPQLLSPVAGGESDTATPELRLSAEDADGDALVYEIRFSGLGEVLTATGKAGDEAVVALAEPLVENGAYAWSAKASDGVEDSAYSAEQTFFVNAVQEAPSVPQLTAGTGGVLDGEGLLAWTACTDADPGDTVTYRVEVADSADFASPVLVAETAGVQIALNSFEKYLDLVDGNAYVWRVAAVDNHGMASTSAISEFVYDTAMLTVTANLPKARVYLTGDFAYPGRFVDTVPCSFRDLAAGRYTVVVENPGCETVIKQVEVTETGNATVAAELQLAIEPVLRNAADLRSGSGRLQVNSHAAPVAVDLDADGLIDLLVGDGFSNVVNFYKALDQRGAKIQYAEPKVLTPGSFPAVVDWNDDDRFELLVGQVGGEVMLYTGSAGGFWRGALLPNVNVSGAAAPAVIDFDNDGDKDLVVGSDDGELWLYLNTPKEGSTSPTLGEGKVIGKFTGAVVPLVADWNADGVRDLLVSNNGALNLLGKGADGLYAAVATIATVGQDTRYFIADVDGGNGKDVFVGTESGQVQLYRSAGKEYVPAVLVALNDKVAQLKELGADPAQLALVTAAIDAKNYAEVERLLKTMDGEGELGVAIGEFLGLFAR